MALCHSEQSEESDPINGFYSEGLIKVVIARNPAIVG
jgi:hypothetical protein